MIRTTKEATKCYSPTSVFVATVSPMPLLSTTTEEVVFPSAPLGKCRRSKLRRAHPFRQTSFSEEHSSTESDRTRLHPQRLITTSRGCTIFRASGPSPPTVSTSETRATLTGLIGLNARSRLSTDPADAPARRGERTLFGLTGIETRYTTGATRGAIGDATGDLCLRRLLRR